MNSDRIKEIQQTTAYPESRSVHQALLKVWNETAQGMSKEPPMSEGSDEATGYRRTKVKLHTELNEAFGVLLGLCLELDCRAYHKTLLSGRSFLSNMVDNSELPSV